MTEGKKKILIVEDDLDIADMLNAYFRIQGYEVLTANWGEEGVQKCEASHPDLVILDIRLPDIDGYEVALRLRSNRRMQDIPIIFLTEKGELPDKLQGFELGADDYITKPFDVQELRLRVRNTLRRTSHDSLTNPVTGLPDGRLVDEHLGECLQHLDWMTIVVSLENLEVFREAYGFVASDDVLRAVSLMILNAHNELSGPEDFLGHLAQTDFILITSRDRAGPLRERILKRLEQSLDYFYPIKDRKRHSSRPKRLAIRMGMFQGGVRTFESLDQLKLALLRGHG